MDETQKLSILKCDLMMLTNSNDEYLKFLLKSSISNMKREGIVDDDTDDYNLAVIHYAAYLFRKRAGVDTSMPRFLRYELNNIKYSQKSK